jgi:hypothetical protein
LKTGAPTATRIMHSVIPSAAPSSRASRVSAAWLCIALGSCLRLTWSLDFEWKSDERWMFGEAQRIAQGVDPWPWVGMPSGIGVQNPGASVWAFAALAHLAHDPVSMTRAVALLNVLSLWGFAWWVRATWAPRDRAVGLWGVALFALSPLPILFARKIWAQDLLPALLVPWLWAHAKRERVPAAFAWGACGALLGQVHMSGFFAAAALALATLLVERRQGGTRWRAWLAGSACGASATAGIGRCGSSGRHLQTRGELDCVTRWDRTSTRSCGARVCSAPIRGWSRPHTPGS